MIHNIYIFNYKIKSNLYYYIISKMSAWYECTGPTAQEVRSDVYKYITSSNIERIKYQKDKDKIIQEALHKIIPDNRNDFGSWRGYGTFGVMKQVAEEVINEICLK